MKMVQVPGWAFYCLVFWASLTTIYMFDNLAIRMDVPRRAE